MTQQPKPKCRGEVHHISPKNRILDHKHCMVCKAQVLLTANKHCQCCGAKWNFKNKKSKRPMQNVLNHFIDSYQELIEWWIENPQTKPIILELKHGSWVYQIGVRWLAKYHCMPELDAHLLPTPVMSDDFKKFGKKKVRGVHWVHDNRAGEHERLSKRFVDYDKVQATLDLIRPYLRKVDFEITWGKTRVSSHQD